MERELVEAAGIEPASRDASTSASTCLVRQIVFSRLEALPDAASARQLGAFRASFPRAEKRALACIATAHKTPTGREVKGRAGICLS